eukprot:TRINITY_DN22886_c1_g2_i2.p1 TRINITY_DN22886_c1_g2~~TRINITY_DN22886_c1_g2_i2.p1  ORF type:complete len:184 (-),score=46.58 TRINITY_DN22886_c1_g2_i2:104-574(-)
MDVLKSMMDFSLLKDPKFLLVGVSNIFGFLGFYIPFIYLPSLVESREGISESEAAMVLSVIGISNTVGRILTGILSSPSPSIPSWQLEPQAIATPSTTSRTKSSLLGEEDGSSGNGSSGSEIEMIGNESSGGEEAPGDEQTRPAADQPLNADDNLD